jgi:CBS-domain-containing membrane protein
MTAVPDSQDRDPKARRRFIATTVAGAAGGAAAIAIMEWLSARAAFPLMFVPFATSIVLVMGSPDAEPAQPRALVGGHLISTFIGLIVLQVAGPASWAAALAVGLAMLAMHLTRTFHPPAGIDPLLVVVNNMGWSFLSRPGGARRVHSRRLRIHLAQHHPSPRVAEPLVVRRPNPWQAKPRARSPAPVHGGPGG